MKIKKFFGLGNKYLRYFIFQFIVFTTCMITWAEVDSSETNLVLNDPVQKAYKNMPLHLEDNKGQIDSQIKFLSRGRGFNMFLTHDEVVLVLNKPFKSIVNNMDKFRKVAKSEQNCTNTCNVLRIKFVDANPSLQIKAIEELPGKSNYFIGNDPEKWLTNIQSYRKVLYQEVYPGINVVFYGNQQQLEYDFVVMPGACPEVIKLAFKGAEKLSLDKEGNLIMYVAGDRVLQSPPIVYQEIGNIRRKIAASYILKGKDMVRFQIAQYDPTKPLIIDPVIVYSTYFGGSEGEGGWDITVDASGNAYVVGRTGSLDLPAINTFKMNNDGDSSDAFVAKLDPTGSVLLYSTYLGGSKIDKGEDIGVDAFGNVYVTGETWSIDFPTKYPLQAAYGGGDSDAFVTKLDPTGSIVYSTYLGGRDFDQGAGIDVSSNGNAYILGTTVSTDFPTKNPFQATYGGGDSDAFVTKLDPTGSEFLYSTYLGGRGYDNFDPDVNVSHFAVFGDIDVDVLGNAYITGATSSTDFPTKNPFQATYGGGDSDAFVAKLDTSGSTLIYSTFLGGSKIDKGAGIAVDVLGNAYITGATSSTDFPTANPLQADYGGGGSDAFVTKLDTYGVSLLYSTYLGGEGFENFDPEMNIIPFAINGDIAVNASGESYVIGTTSSTDFPTANPLQADYGGGETEVFVTKIDQTGSEFLYSTYLGGSGTEAGMGIVLNASGNAYVTGATGSKNFLTVNPLQSIYGGGEDDAFIAKISTEPEIIICLQQGFSQKYFRVFVSNESATSKNVEIKIWVDSPTFGISHSFVGECYTFTFPAFLPLSEVTRNNFISLPNFLPFPGTSVGGRLLDPVSGDIISESICTDVPCNQFSVFNTL